MKIQRKILIIMIIISIFINSIICTTYAHAEISSTSGNINQGLAESVYSNQQSSTETQSNSADITNQTYSVPEPDFTLYSEGAILIDSNTGVVLYGKNENEKLYPASTTKILTAIIAIENCKLTDKITASYDAVMSIPVGYSNAAIQPGETLTVQELLDMFLIQSANEVGYIFAEHISGNIENFATLMNQKAASLGCKNTHFTNPSGIHDIEHYTTAYDLALIARYCMQNETFREIVAKTSCTIEATDKYEERYFRNTNNLLIPSSQYYYEYAIGIKTGYTSQARCCLVAASVKNNLELITVTLGARTEGTDRRFEDTINLFEYGYSNYSVKNISTKGEIAQEIIVENATRETENLSLLIKDDITGIVPSSLNVADINPSIKLNDSLVAPIAEGTVLGKITYNIGGFEYSSDLIASHNVEEFDVITILWQVALALVVLFILAKLLLPKKNSKNKNYKNKKTGFQKHKKYQSKRSSDTIYKF